ncbi:MAG: tetratricopeptide repeat protein [Acidobacteria bacterium]|nr:tetratricopeptide repeat protein [Acidobacteriota bacterium]MCB9397850.1 tetratricopeptide repeat protein [Acidobacteriota bacterium]
MKRFTLLLIMGGWSVFGQFNNVTRGNVFDSQNQGIPGVKMTFKSLDESRKFEKVIETDENGAFTIAGLQPVEIELLCEKEGYRPQIFRFKQPLGEKKFDMQMLTIEEAIEEAKASGEIPPEDPKELAKGDYNLAVPLYKEKKYAEAMEHIQASLEKDPELDHSLKLAAYISHTTEDWPNAIKYTDAYLKLHPDDTNMMKLAYDAAERANNKEALNKYKESIKNIEGVTPEGLYNEAVVKLNQGDDDGAKPILEELIKMKPDYADAYHRLGEIYVREGEFELAITNLKKFLKLAPNHKNAKEVEDLLLTLIE